MPTEEVRVSAGPQNSTMHMYAQAGSVGRDLPGL